MFYKGKADRNEIQTLTTMVHGRVAAGNVRGVEYAVRIMMI